MTENNEALNDDVVRPDGGTIEGGIAILPKTDKRPIAIVGMGTTDEAIAQVKQLSERLTQIGMGHVQLSVEDAKKEGITKEDLLSAQMEQAQTDGLLGENPLFDGRQKLKKGGGSKAQQKFKRKKKGKKTHRKKR